VVVVASSSKVRDCETRESHSSSDFRAGWHGCKRERADVRHDKTRQYKTTTSDAWHSMAQRCFRFRGRMGRWWKAGWLVFITSGQLRVPDDRHTASPRSMKPLSFGAKQDEPFFPSERRGEERRGEDTYGVHPPAVRRQAWGWKLGVQSWEEMLL
jgi:hypothetical protein